MVVVRASEIAAVAGMHDFRSQDDAVRAVLCGSDYVKRKQVESCVELRDTPQETVIACAKALGVATATVAAVETGADAGALAELKRKVIQRVDADAMRVAKGTAPAVVVPPALEGVAQRHIGMAQGTVEEASILVRARAQEPRLQSAVAAKQRQLVLGPDIVLRGVADAVDAQGYYVVEIKRRRGRLFHEIPLYERVQLEAYMRLYGIMDGMLVESHGEALAVHWVEQDDELWDNVVLAVQQALGEP